MRQYVPQGKRKRQNKELEKEMGGKPARNHLRDLGVDGRIIWTRDSEK
jgi:hypothetical protein